MEQELKEITKTMLLEQLNKEFKKCKHYVFFIDNEVLRIKSVFKDFEYQRVYIDPIAQLVYTSGYVNYVLEDYKRHFVRWIIAQFRGI